MSRKQAETIRPVEVEMISIDSGVPVKRKVRVLALTKDDSRISANKKLEIGEIIALIIKVDDSLPVQFDLDALTAGKPGIVKTQGEVIDVRKNEHDQGFEIAVRFLGNVRFSSL